MNAPRSSRKRFRRRATATLARALVPGLLRLLARTWRVRRIHGELAPGATHEGERPVYAIWHRSIPSALGTHRGQPVRVMISQHRDGETIARIAERLGVGTVRGSSSRGSRRAVRDMLRAAEDPEALVFTPDGPRGPAESVAPGVVWLAAAVGRPVVPGGFAASRAWVANSWDRMALPKPFAKVVVHYGPAVEPPADFRDEAAVERGRERVRAALREAQRGADAALAEWTGRAPTAGGDEESKQRAESGS